MRTTAMSLLGDGLYAGNHYEDALSVTEAELSVRRRVGASERDILVAQGNLASIYNSLSRYEEALSMQQAVYSGTLKLFGEENKDVLVAADCYLITLCQLKRFEEAKALVLKTMPVARRVLGDDHDLTLTLRWTYAEVLYKDDGATLGDFREAVTTLECLERIARRVLGSAHPTTTGIECEFRYARALLRARETPSPSPSESS